MPKATRYPCCNCGNSFVLEFFLQQNRQLCCLFCNTQSKTLAKVDKLEKEIVSLKKKLLELEERQQGQVSEAVIRTGENNISSIENSTENGFTVVRGSRKASVPKIDSATVPLENRFAVLQEEAEPELDVVLVGDSLVRDQGRHFCHKKPRRKVRSYRGKKIEYITERVDYLVENSTEDSMFVTVIGTNNLRCDTAADIVAKYRDMIRKFASKRRKVAVCGIIPRYDVGPETFRKMSVVNREVRALCRQEGQYFFDLWHHFCQDKTLYARDSIHLSEMGKMRLGRAIGECLAEIPHPPVAENGSTAEEEASIANEVTANSVAGSSLTAPENESIERQEEEVDRAEVPEPMPGCSMDQDFR